MFYLLFFIRFFFRFFRFLPHFPSLCRVHLRGERVERGEGGRSPRPPGEGVLERAGRAVFSQGSFAVGGRRPGAKGGVSVCVHVLCVCFVCFVCCFFKCSSSIGCVLFWVEVFHFIVFLKLSNIVCVCFLTCVLVFYFVFILFLC